LLVSKLLKRPKFESASSVAQLKKGDWSIKGGVRRNGGGGKRMEARNGLSFQTLYSKNWGGGWGQEMAKTSVYRGNPASFWGKPETTFLRRNGRGFQKKRGERGG